MSVVLDPERSRLAFEERLVEYCEDDSVPLLERVRLLGIAAGRLDTFFMTRVGRLKRLAAIGHRGRKDLGLTPAQQLDLVAAETHRVMGRVYRLLETELLPALARVGIVVEQWNDLAPEDREFVRDTFAKRLKACVRPLEVGPAAPFPHVRNLRPAVIAVPTPRDRRGAADALMVLELPERLPRFVPLAGGLRLIPLEEVIEGLLPVVWPRRRFAHVHVFRVTRSAIMELDSESDDDVLEIVEQEVARRPFQEVVRVEYELTMPADLRERLLGDLRREAEMQGSSLDERDMYGVSRFIDLAALKQIAAMDFPDLKEKPIERRSPDFGRSIIDVVRQRDVIVNFPFDAYEATLERLLDEASRRRDVEAIKITLYRAGKDSKVVDALRAARARGVDVTAVVELKASFDERDNIELARALEASGVRVVLSPPNLKVHAKTGLITLRNGGRIAMIGTGNLNAETAKSYIDLWLLTADADRTAELDAMFGRLTGQDETPEFRTLMVSPYNMRPRFLELIDREADHARAGRPSGIRAAMNGLTDREIIEALSRASRAGASIELMVRGVCALQPGVPGVSENIRIVSVVGHLLQHARIYEFTNGGAEEYFIGSADWRPRNMDHRVEVITSVHREHHPRLRAALDETLHERGAWVLGSDGVYVRTNAADSREPLTAAART